MKSLSKTALKVILSLGFFIGFVLMTGEAEDAKVQFAWTIFWLGEIWLSGWGLTKVCPEMFGEDEQV